MISSQPRNLRAKSLPAKKSACNTLAARQMPAANTFRRRRSRSGRHSKRRAGDLHGGHRCRELWSAYCLSLFPRSLLQHRVCARQLGQSRRLQEWRRRMVLRRLRLQKLTRTSSTASGWMIDGELVPFDEAMPVAPPDGQVTICRRPDGTRRCVFGLKPGLIKNRRDLPSRSCAARCASYLICRAR